MVWVPIDRPVVLNDPPVPMLLSRFESQDKLLVSVALLILYVCDTPRESNVGSLYNAKPICRCAYGYNRWIISHYGHGNIITSGISITVGDIMVTPMLNPVVLNIIQILPG